MCHHHFETINTVQYYIESFHILLTSVCVCVFFLLQYELGDYSWLTYTELDTMAENFGRGLRAIGHQPHENIIIFAETRVEWMVAAMACFKQSMPLCTLYATLGDEAVIHGINETEAR